MASTEQHASLRGRVLPYRPELDGLRALSLLMVMSAHLGTASFEFGFLGVDVFFVLSGYLITELLIRSPRNLRTFYRRRFARLAPALFVMVAFVVALSFVGVWSFPWWVPFVALGYGMNFVGFFMNDGIADPLTPTWSLAAEEQFYLLWPLLLLTLVPRIGRRRLAMGLVLLVASIFVIQFFTWDLVSESTLRHGPFFRPVGLLLGSAVSLYGTFRTFSSSPKWAWMLYGGTVALACIGLTGSNGMFVSAATALALIALNQQEPLTRTFIRILSLAPLAALGRRSYSLYLWNLPMMMLSTHVLGNGAIGIAAGILATFSFGFASFRFVELPMLRRFAT